MVRPQGPQDAPRHRRHTRQHRTTDRPHRPHVLTSARILRICNVNTPWRSRAGPVADSRIAADGYSLVVKRDAPYVGGTSRY